jgi:hypothetical protein
MTLPAIAGILVIVTVLWDAFETIVLPRRVARWFRLTRLFYLSTWIPYRAIARGIRARKHRETYLSFYGPLSILLLFVLWAASLVVGFGLLYYAARTNSDPALYSLPTCIYMSGTSFFTLGIGDVTPHSSAERVLVVFESGLGFGFLALVISYLPVVYQAFSRREVNIVLLDARAGSPPTAAEILRRHAGPNGVDALQQLLRDWERWSAEILESHVSYPMVSYFRSQHSNESWLAALAAILDVSSLMIANVESACARQARLTFAMCRHTVVDLSQVFYRTPLRNAPDRLPPAELERLRASLKQFDFHFQNTPAAEKKLAELRGMYEPYMQALAAYLYVDLPPWILAQEIMDNWRTSAWGRISGLAAAGPRDPAVDDHSD